MKPITWCFWYAVSAYSPAQEKFIGILTVFALKVTYVYMLDLLTLHLDCPTCDDFEALLETVEDLKNKVRLF